MNKIESTRMKVFVEEAYGVGFQIDTLKTNEGCLIEAKEVAGKGNLWEWYGLPVKVKQAYSDEFELIEEFPHAFVYADLNGQTKQFYVVPKLEGYPYTPCYRFQTIQEAMSKVNTLSSLF